MVFYLKNRLETDVVNLSQVTLNKQRKANALVFRINFLLAEERKKQTTADE